LAARAPKLRSILLPLVIGLALAPRGVAVAQELTPLLRNVPVASDFTPLPEFPVCEASAIAGHSCATAGTTRCVLVGDNEEEGTLFEYTLGPSGLASKSPTWKRKLPDEVEDIEALTRLDGDVIVVGSHGRKKDCSRDEERLRILRARSGSGADLTSVAKIRLEDPKRWAERLGACAKDLIRLPDGASAEQIALRDGVCRAITQAEAAAGEKELPKSDEEGRAKCTATFNVEGALVLADDAGKERLWLGLRAPLFEKQAILLRVADLASSDEGVRFDGVATVDLGGRGIRELAADADWIYGIAGTMADGDSSTLWRAAATDLKSGVRIASVHTFVSGLPGGAEGLFVQSPPGQALIVIDGEKDGTTCIEPARQVVTGVPVFRRMMK
jgi:hypothetical protein